MSFKLTSAMTPEDAERTRELVRKLRDGIGELAEHVERATAGAELNAEQQQAVAMFRQLGAVIGDDFLLGELRADVSNAELLGEGQRLAQQINAHQN